MICCLVVVPFAVLTWVIGFVVYLNHTHPDVVWFRDRREWTHLAGQVDATVNVCFAPPLAWFVGNIMHHPAHHVHPGVPLANLDAAQARLNAILGSRAHTETWSFRRHAMIVRSCKLYDYELHRWITFDGVAGTDPKGTSDPCVAPGIPSSGQGHHVIRLADSKRQISVKARVPDRRRSAD
jgi:Fatty acid desaturase